VAQGNSSLSRGVNPRKAPLPVLASLDGEGPVWQQIRRALAKPIVTGEWPPGTRIPAELDLTKRFNTSRMTVGKAVQSLASDGFVERKRKLGTVVADRAHERPVFEIWDVADLVTKNGGTYGYQLLECMKLKLDPERRELLGVSGKTPTLWMLCLHMSNGQAFQLEERLINIDAAPGITCRPLETVGPGLWLLGHVPWTAAEHKISAREAPGDIAGHLGKQPGAACLVVERRTWNKGTPVTYARLWHCGANHSLVGHFEPAY
jgi:GntR family histidine utilization transcriptional repressor